MWQEDAQDAEHPAKRGEEDDRTYGLRTATGGDRDASPGWWVIARPGRPYHTVGVRVGWSDGLELVRRAMLPGWAFELGTGFDERVLVGGGARVGLGQRARACRVQREPARPCSVLVAPHTSAMRG
jgi:hypothetical protein